MNQNFNNGMIELREIVFQAIHDGTIVKTKHDHWKLANSQTRGSIWQVRQAKKALLKKHSNIASLGNVVNFERGVPVDIHLEGTEHDPQDKDNFIFHWFPYGDQFHLLFTWSDGGTI